MRNQGRNRKGIQWTRVAVVGAGPAGIAASGELARAGIPHVVLERDRVGSSWRAQRWDAFRLNTPNWANRVGHGWLDRPANAFATASSLVESLERSADGLPVVEGVLVRRARPVGPLWRLEASDRVIVASDLVVASGFQNVPRRPSFAADIPATIQQLHSADYRRPDDVGSTVLVVGGGQSGVQIADDLLDAGKRVYVATSRVGRLPRRHRGRDAFEWLRDTGQLHVTTEDADPSLVGAAPPQISGVGGGRTVSYQYLARRGAVLLGRALGCRGGRLFLARDLGANIWFADETARVVRAAWDERAGGAETATQRDAADEDAPELYELAGPSSVALDAEGISTVIWATGYGPSVGWLPPNALDSRGRSQLPGLHAIGAPWLSHRASSNLYGMRLDAEELARRFDADQVGAVA